MTEAARQIQNIKENMSFQKLTDIIHYGLPIQRKMAEFSDIALKIVYQSGLGFAEERLSSLMYEIQNFETEERKGLFGKSRRIKLGTKELQEKYSRTSQLVENVQEELIGHKIQLLRDIHILEDLSQKNQVLSDELDLYITAGREILEEKRGSAQESTHIRELCDEFERRLQYLIISKTTAMQLEPQFRLLQKNQSAMESRINSVINNVIPMWKNRIAVLLGLEDMSRRSDAPASAPGTLEQTNEELLKTFADVVKIQKEGQEQRRHMEQELKTIKIDLHL